MSGPNPPEVVAPPPQDVELRALVFTDAESAKKWAHSLPLTNVALVCETVQGQLKALVRRGVPPRERATIAEVLRDLIALSAHRARAAVRGQGDSLQSTASSRPPSTRSRCGRGCGSNTRRASSRCSRAIPSSPASRRRSCSVASTSASSSSSSMDSRGGRCRRRIWHELHAYFRLAEMLECAVTAVSDNLIPNAVGISCYSTYSHALLLGLADPCAMSVKQIELTDRWLAMWARKVFPYARAARNRRPGRAHRPRRRNGRDARAGAPGERRRIDALRLPGKARDERARSTEAAADGRQPGRAAARPRLQRRAVHGAARPPRRAVVSAAAPHDGGARRRGVELCAGGLPARIFVSAGARSSERIRRSRCRSRRPSNVQTLAAGRRLRPRPRGCRTRMAVGALARRARSRDAAICARSDALHRWSLEQLAIVRATGDCASAA